MSIASLQSGRRIPKIHGMTRLALLLVLFALASNSRAMPDGNAVIAGMPSLDVPAQQLPTAQDRVTLEQAVRRVRKQYGGRIISAETKGSGARRVHVVKVLTDKGRVHTVRISAN